MPKVYIRKMRAVYEWTESFIAGHKPYDPASHELLSHYHVDVTNHTVSKSEVSVVTTGEIFNIPKMLRTVLDKVQAVHYKYRYPDKKAVPDPLPFDIIPYSACFRSPKPSGTNWAVTPKQPRKLDTRWRLPSTHHYRSWMVLGGADWRMFANTELKDIDYGFHAYQWIGDQWVSMTTDEFYDEYGHIFDLHQLANA